MYDGYLALGGVDGVGTTEIINFERTKRYLQNLMPDFAFQDLYPAEDLPSLLGHGQSYGTPLADGAPWVDPDDPATTDFMGLFPTGLSGFEDGTHEAEAVELVTDGGVVTGGREAGREMRVKALLIASTDAGLNSGMKWLRNVLAESPCDDVSLGCSGREMMTLSATPEACAEMLVEEIGASGVHQCLVPYVRMYHRVSLISGPRIIRQHSPRCGAMVEVEFILYAGVPQPHLLPEFIGTSQGQALESYENLSTNPSFEGIGGFGGRAGVEDGPYVTTSTDTSWADTGNQSLKLTPVRERIIERRSYVVNPSLEVDASGWAVSPGDPATGQRTTGDAYSGNAAWTETFTGDATMTGVRIPLAPVSTSGQISTAVHVKIPTLPDNIEYAYIHIVLYSGGAIVSQGGTTMLWGPDAITGWARLSRHSVNMPPGQLIDEVQIRFGVRELEFGPFHLFGAGDTVLFDAVIVEDVQLAGPYFDGDTPPSGDTTYSWSPSGGSEATRPGAVASNRTYADLVVGDFVYGMSPGQSYVVSAVLRIDAPQATPLPIEARTIQVRADLGDSTQVFRSEPAPNVAGAHRVTLPFTLPASAVGARIRLYSGGAADSWWDSVIVTDGLVPVEYFDGSTPDGNGWDYTWLGTPNASASTAEYNPNPPELVGNVVCDPEQETVVLRRNLLVNPATVDPTGWKVANSFGSFTKSHIGDTTRRPGGASVRVLRNSSDPSVYMAYLTHVGYPNRAGRPKIQAGQRYTVSLYVKTSVNARARMRVEVHNSNHEVIANYQHASYVTTTANTWHRIFMSFTAPSGAYSAGVGAWTFRPSGRAQQGDLSWFTDALFERSNSVEDWFDGGSPDTVDIEYLWEGFPNKSTSVATEQVTGDMLLDPDCVFVPAPPKPPVIDVDCIDTPDEWTRYFIPISNEFVPLWGAAVPVITMRTGETAARQVRIRFYPLLGPDVPFNECDYEGEFILTYLPPATELVIDGVRRTANASVGEAPPISALHLLHGTAGLPYSWATLRCDRDYMMTVDFAPAAEDVTVSLDLVGRE